MCVQKKKLLAPKLLLLLLLLKADSLSEAKNKRGLARCGVVPFAPLILCVQCRNNAFQMMMATVNRQQKKKDKNEKKKTE